MMYRPSKPGQRCRIVSSRTIENREGDSPNAGKIVTTVFKHEQLAGGTQTVWRVRAAEGESLITYYGVTGPEVDALETWLELLPPETPPVKTRETEVTQ